MRLLVIGFGNVGRELAEIVSRREGYPGLASLDITLVGVLTARHGVALDPHGLDPAQLLKDYASGHLGLAPMSLQEALERVEPDVVVELTTLDIDTEGQSATAHCEQALQNLCHVVTANKGPIAFHGARLEAIARDVGRHLLYESTVMDGCPVFSLAREGLRGACILGFEAILNSTSNFVLNSLQEGKSVEESVLVAQRMGIAEADPRLDLEGWDSAAKVTILANALMGGRLHPNGVRRQGIEAVTEAVLADARTRCGTVKLVCEAVREGTEILAAVGPKVLPYDHPFSHTGPLGGALLIRTDLMTPLLVQQDEPTPTDTAYGVLNDLLTIAATAGRIP